MGKRGLVYYNGEPAGVLEKQGGTYVFTYLFEYLNKPESRSVSITLPKRPEPYTSDFLFPFFSNLLSEGVNKKIQCQKLRIDENDYFNLLLQTTQEETIGAITVKPID